MTLIEAYKQSIKKLKNPEVDEISVRILLCHNNGIKSMSGFYIHKNENVRDLPGFLNNFQRFLDGEPIQYILGETEFMGLDFYVDNRVLIPRQETEEVVAQAYLRALKVFGDHVINVADVCCGSGIMGISLAKKLKVRYLFMSDISADAVEVAKKNCARHDVIANFFVGNACDELEKAGAKVDLFVANPPYILKKEDVDEAVLKHEPHIALFTDENLKVYEDLFKKLPLIKNKQMLCVFEIGYDIKDKLEELIQRTLRNVDYAFRKDINGKERILILMIR
ncbi:MAG: peptide chain release factor N(5)-glutamine methyltransferase [Alphaproteobacteria bacterium]|nr:peptide chain release factor N(5)-glutamine methyltransferase [Alphaproteobacteria bacterium]